MSKHGKLGDTSVLELDVTKAVEALLVGIGEHTEGIEEPERRLGTDLALEGIEGGLRGDLGCRGESGGRSDEGGGNGGLHDDGCNVCVLKCCDQIWRENIDRDEILKVQVV